ncbi:hypothetical protein ACS0KR_004110 [Vibrio alginolyticus]
MKESKVLYLLDGVEDFLTNSARIHKRNLMFFSSACLTISFLGQGKVFDSVLGFKFEGSSVTSNQILFILIIATLYELIVLWCHYGLCKTHWIGGNLARKINAEEKRKTNEPDKFKGNISVGLLMSNCEIDEFENKVKDIECEIESGAKDIIKKLDLFNERIEKINEKTLDDNCFDKMELAAEKIRHINDLDPRTDKGDYSQSYLGFLTDIKSEYESFLFSVQGSSQEVNRKNEIIKSSTDEIVKIINNPQSNAIKEISSVREKISHLENQFNSIQIGSLRFVILDFIIPTVFCIMSLSAGVSSILTPKSIDNINSQVSTKLVEVREYINNIDVPKK